jgi:hypothetical protein
VAEPSNGEATSGFESRLERLEHTVKSLTSSVDEALCVLSVETPRRDLTKLTNTSVHKIADEGDRPRSHLYVGPSHSFSFLQETPAGIERLPRQEFEESRQGAIFEIDNMSSGLTTAQIRNTVESSAKFHVPSRSVGYALLSSELPSPPITIHH